MNTEELKMIVELFATITDGALIGGVTYLLIHLISEIFPWLISGWLFSKLINKIHIKKKGKE